MVYYVCPRCNYKTNDKSRYRSHLKRKIICDNKDSDVNLQEEYIKYNISEKINNMVKVSNEYQTGSNEYQTGSNEYQIGSKSVENNEILTKNGKLQCEYCKKVFLQKEYLEKHLKKYCKMLINFNNIYNINNKTTGRFIYKKNPNSGNIYIIQTDYVNNDHYKIGITINLNRRLREYRCSNTYEPRLHYYFPCQDLKIIDSLLNNKLLKYNVKREIFKGNINDIKNDILNLLSEQFKIKNPKVFEPELKLGDLTQCVYCNKYFYTSKDLFHHFNICNDYKEILNRKKNNQCEYCDKEFSFKQSYYRHLKTCKDRKRQEEADKSMLELVNILNQQLKEQKEEFKKELDKKNKQIDELIKKAGIQNSTITNNIQNNIKLLAYQDTDLSKITDFDIKKCLRHSNMCVPHLIKMIHLDPEKPENHNVYISNLKNGYIMLYDGSKWNTHNREEIIENMIDEKQIIIEEKIEDWIQKGKQYPTLMKKFERYINKKESNEVLNKIKQEVKLMLYNNKEIVYKE